MKVLNVRLKGDSYVMKTTLFQTIDEFCSAYNLSISDIAEYSLS